MIALFRRLRSTAGQIRAAEWLLLAIETIAVVGGILIAFELEQWADDRREAKDVDRALFRLLDEAREATGEYRYWTQDLLLRIEVVRAETAELAEGRCPAEMRGVTATDMVLNMAPSRTASEELINTVGTGAIPTERLRNALFKYDFQNNIYEQLFDSLWLGQLLPDDDPRRSYRVQSSDGERAPGGTLSSAPTDDDPGAQKLAMEDGFSTHQTVKGTVDADALCGDASFRKRYLASLSRLEGLYGLRSDTMVVAADLCMVLGDYLGSDCFASGRLTELNAEEKAHLLDLVERYRKHPLWGPESGPAP